MAEAPEQKAPPPEEPKLTNIRLVREFITNRNMEQVRRLASYIATSNSGNTALIEKLRGKEGLRLVAELTEVVMLHLGHAAPLPADDSASKTRRLVASQRRVTS